MKKYIDKTKTIDGEEFDLHDSRLIDAVPEGKFLSDDFTWKKVEMPVVTQVIPNPPLEGDEDNLTGLQVGEVKYKVKDDRLPEATEQGKILQVGENGWQEATLPKDIQIVELSNWGLTDLTDEQYTLLTEANVIIKLNNYYFYKGEVQVDYKINYICPLSHYSSNSRFWYCIDVYINPTSPEYKKYQVVSGSWIDLCQANPNLSGSETELTSLAIGDTKYKIPSGEGAVVTVNYPDYSLGGISITDEQVELLKKPNTILVRTYDNSSMIYIQDQSYIPSGSLIFYINPNYGAWANNDKTEIKYRRAQVNIDTKTIWFSQQSIFKIDANDSLSGNEPELTSLYIRDRLYKIPSGGAGLTVVELTGYSGTLTTEQKTALEGDNAIIKWNDPNFSNTVYLYKYGHSYPISEGSTIYYCPPYHDVGSNISDSIYVNLSYGGSSTSWNAYCSYLTEYKIRNINSSITSSSPNLTSLNLNGTTYKIASSGETLIKTTYSNLKSLRDNSQLIPGCWYRITNYRTKVNSAYTTGNHYFDVLVLATSNNTLSEEARAIQHEGDTYFSNCNLNAWKLWYSLDNDSKYLWADTSNGRGVIYKMIDEFGNEAPYDFKNVRDNQGNYLLDYNNEDASVFQYTTNRLFTIKNNVFRPRDLGLGVCIKIIPQESGELMSLDLSNNIFEGTCNGIITIASANSGSLWVTNNKFIRVMSINLTASRIESCIFSDSLSINTSISSNNYLSSLHNLKIYNCNWIAFENFHSVENCTIDGCDSLNFVISNLYNLNVHPGLRGNSSQDPLLISSVSTSSSYSTDIYPQNSQNITLGGNN